MFITKFCPSFVALKLLLLSHLSLLLHCPTFELGQTDKTKVLILVGTEGKEKKGNRSRFCHILSLPFLCYANEKTNEAFAFSTSVAK